MKSIKPGRGPSMMNGISSIGAAVFGVIWTVTAASMGGGIFALFGLVFIIMAVVQAVYNFKNASSEERYSVFDITDGNEEADPLNRRFGNVNSDDIKSEGVSFCPYCGSAAEADFAFCAKCGRELPKR